MKFTRNDILLFLGIIVAVIITLTTLIYTERASASSATQISDPGHKRTSLNTSGIAKKVAVWLHSQSRVSY